MHARLRARATEAEFSEADGSLLVLPYVAEDTQLACAALAEWAAKFHIPISESKPSNSKDSDSPAHIIDTLVSILTLCSVPNPSASLHALVSHTLKPGGQFLFYEHVRSPDARVARLQDILRPVWAVAFGGCRLGVEGVKAVREAGNDVGLASGDESGWESLDVWPKLGESEQSLFYHQIGRAVKRN